MSPDALLDPARLDRPDTLVRHAPFPFMIAHGQLPDEARGDLDRDFPRYTSAGFFPWDPADCGPSVNALVEQGGGALQVSPPDAEVLLFGASFKV